MVENAPPDFERIITLAYAVFENVRYELNHTPERVLLRMSANYLNFDIRVAEIASSTQRKYSYYALRGEYIEAGFDNRADPFAIRLKYGKISRERANDLIPHLHLADKTELYFTEEITFSGFLEWLQTNLR